MKHKTKVVDTRTFSDGHVGILIQCCDDPNQQSWMVLDAGIAANAGSLAESLEAHHRAVAQAHRAISDAHESLSLLVGHEREH